MKTVYLYTKTNEISFDYEKNKCVAVAETDGSLEDFLGWMELDWRSRDCDLSKLPDIKST